MTRQAWKPGSWSRSGRGDGRRALVLAACITPFRGAGIDADGFEENSRFQDAMGLDGILVAGTTGEAAKLSPHERDALVRRAVASISADVLVLAGIKPADGSVAAAVADIACAAAAGADVALVAPPFAAIDRAREESALPAWYAAVSVAARLPILVYHPPSFKTAPLADDTVVALGRVPRLAGVKDSTGDARRTLLWCESKSESFGVFVGSARLFPNVVDRVSGAILGIASVFAEQYAELARRLADGQDVAELQLSVEESLQRFEGGGIAALKEMHEEAGLFGGESAAR